MIKFTEDNIQDNEFRVIGSSSHGQQPEPKPGGKWKKPVLWSLAAIVLAVLLVVGSRLNNKADMPVQTVYEPEKTILHEVFTAQTVPAQFGSVPDSVSEPQIEHLVKTINDISLDIYIPHNVTPTLSIGTPDYTDKKILLVTQAADIRADNGKINGAFVIDGKPMANGLSKKGFCGIIDGKVSIGVADNSPLFEEATEKEGYFFRQYPLVDNGNLVENEPKGKSIRKSLCDRNGEVFVAMSQTPESFHDFAQALVDLGVDNAIYLVGSADSYGFYRENGQLHEFASKRRGGQKYENYILWRAE